MALIPRMTVTAPEPIGRRPGLFDAASGPLDLPRHGEGGGVGYVPLTCGTGYGIGVSCYDPGEAPAKPIGDVPDEVDTGVFVALATIACNAVGWTEAEYRDKARRALEGAEQGVVEATFWTGEDYLGADIGILDLEKTAEAIFPPAAGIDQITTVLATLEDYAYRTHQYGYRAYVHAPMRFAPYAAESSLIVKDGNRMLTPNGSVWVFGGGYPGTGAGGASGWPGGGFMHITGQTTVWRAPEIQVYSAFDPESNIRLAVAERAYAVAYDCFNARAEFNPLNLS